jgi:hypothetical protein
MLEKYYEGISSRMMSLLATISDQIDHMGERGRNNELVVAEFLKQHLPHRYTVTTGKVSAAGGLKSKQIDLIIHDRLDTPTLVDGLGFSFAPVEKVYAVIAVKTTLDRGELADAMTSIQSVRELPRTAAFYRTPRETFRVPDHAVLRPRALIFAYKTTWSSPESANAAFVSCLENVADPFRPNGICVLDQCFIVRKPYETTTEVYRTHALMHFFLFLTRSMARMPRYELDLSQYFSEQYGDPAMTDILMSGSPPGDPFE